MYRFKIDDQDVSCDTPDELHEAIRSGRGGTDRAATPPATPPIRNKRPYRRIALPTPMAPMGRRPGRKKRNKAANAGGWKEAHKLAKELNIPVNDARLKLAAKKRQALFHK